MPKVPVGSKVKFLDNYLIKFYFSPTATFPHANWSYFHDINDFGKFKDPDGAKSAPGPLF